VRDTGMDTQSVLPTAVVRLPILLEAVDEAVETALAVRLAVPDRPMTDATTRALIGHLRVLMAEDLGFEADHAVQALFQDGYRLLDLTRRPSVESAHFGAYQYMREVALLTRRFADIYRETQKEADGEGPAARCCSSQQDRS